MEKEDPSVGNERTALAWQRTALTLVAGSAVVSRLTFERLGSAAMASFGVAAILGISIFAESRRRYRRRAPTWERSEFASGRSALAVMLATAAIGLTELAALIVR